MSFSKGENIRSEMDIFPKEFENNIRARNEKFINAVIPLIKESYAHTIDRVSSNEEFCKMIKEKFEELFDATLSNYYTDGDVSVYWYDERERFIVVVSCKLDSHGMTLSYELPHIDLR